eukprot:scaffold319_cov362-Pavlova_lutheri.AAC.22
MNGQIHKERSSIRRLVPWACIYITQCGYASYRMLAGFFTRSKGPVGQIHLAAAFYQTAFGHERWHGPL